MGPSIGTIALLMGFGALGVGAVIIGASLDGRTNPTARYWASFGVGVTAWWLSLILVSLGMQSSLGTVLAVFMVTLGVASLWFGMRAENSKKNKDSWIFFLAFFNALAAALSFVNPIFEYPRISAVVVIVMIALIARECLSVTARKNIFAVALAVAASLYAVVGVVILVRSLFAEPSVVIALSPSSSVAEFFSDGASRFFMGVIMASVVGLSAKPIRQRSVPPSLESRVDVVGAEIENRTKKYLAWARQSDRELTLIMVAIQQVPDVVTVFGLPLFTEARRSLVVTLRDATSPWARIGLVRDDLLIVVIESMRSGDAPVLVESLRACLDKSSFASVEGPALTCVIAFVDTRDDGYDWDELNALVALRLTAASKIPLPRT